MEMAKKRQIGYVEEEKEKTMETSVCCFEEVKEMAMKIFVAVKEKEKTMETSLHSFEEVKEMMMETYCVAFVEERDENHPSF